MIRTEQIVIVLGATALALYGVGSLGLVLAAAVALSPIGPAVVVGIVASLS